MSGTAPVLLWLRRDLRLADHPALCAAVGEGGPVIPVFVRDGSVEALAAAPKWRLGLALERFGQSLAGKGSRLVLRSGDALEVLRALVAETGARAVHWTRMYDAASVDRDAAVKAALKADGVRAVSHPGHLLFEPWEVGTREGGYYKVYTPMWRAVKDRDVPAPLAEPPRVPAPEVWPGSDALADWRTGAAMRRGAAVCLPHQRVGEAAARDRLAWFTQAAIADYRTGRDLPARDATSGLSGNLTWGEIGPRQCWHAGLRARHEGAAGAEAWLKELVWREFAWHLMWHTPHIATGNWRPEWDRFPWREDGGAPEVMAWKQGRTGVPLVDAAMREMYVTGRMHNRGRMVVASYLTRHLMTHWKVGMRWFEECLTDWDPASNALGWQWAAGSGPDAAPYFRIFNPETQRQRFDPEGSYLRRWIAEGQHAPPDTALSWYAAIPRAWGRSPDEDYPAPVVGLKEGRARALAAYEGRDF